MKILVTRTLTMNRIEQIIQDNISTQQAILADKALISTIEKVSELIIATFQAGNKLLFCGNGGSAADAQHLAAEFSGRFLLDRPALFAEALHVNTSALTSIANDYGYENLYARLLESKGAKGDILICISTSGNSPNIINAIHKAKEMGVTTIALSGKGGGDIRSIADINIIVPSDETPRIQESHILVGHIICELVERGMFGTI